MRTKEIKIIECIKIICVFLFLFFYNAYGYQDKTIILIGFCLLVYAGLEFITIFKRGKIYYHYSYLILLGFTIFCFISVLWAENKDLVISRVVALLVLDVIYVSSWNVFVNKENSLEIISKIILLSGFILAIYVIGYYGVNRFITLLLAGRRIGSEINNVNSIGLSTGLSVIICFFYYLFKNKKIYLLLMIIPLIVALGTGSKKVIIMIALATVLMYIIKSREKMSISKVIKLIIPIILFFIIIRMPFFDNISNRMENFIESIFNSESTDTSQSTEERIIFIEAGMEQFIETPFLGIGINNSRYITRRVTDRDTYLHNNYVELLATVGLIGTAIYYSLYIIIIMKIKKYVFKGDEFAVLLFVIFAVQMILEVGYVSYFNISTYFNIMFGYIYLAKKEKEVLKNNDKKNNLQSITNNSR